DYTEYKKLFLLTKSQTNMPRELSEDLKLRIVYMNVDGYSNEDIIKFLYISESTV
ncbi:2388_t:CDS:1, partial [Cetraspora pellucida]